MPEVGGRVQRVDKVKHAAERVAGREATLGAAPVRQTQAHLQEEQVWTSVDGQEAALGAASVRLAGAGKPIGRGSGEHTGMNKCGLPQEVESRKAMLSAASIR